MVLTELVPPVLPHLLIPLLLSPDLSHEGGSEPALPGPLGRLQEDYGVGPVHFWKALARAEAKEQEEGAGGLASVQAAGRSATKGHWGHGPARAARRPSPGLSVLMLDSRASLKEARVTEERAEVGTGRTGPTSVSWRAASPFQMLGPGRVSP